jgi:cytoskeletal protein CcmA (bactofilin family)
MKTNAKILLATLLSVTTLTVFADGCDVQGRQDGTAFYGQTSCNNTILPSLTVRGQLEAQKMTINGPVDIKGNTSGYDVTINGTLTIRGNTTLNNLTVTKPADVKGNLTVSSAKLDQLTLSGNLNATNTTFSITSVKGAANIQDSKINGLLTLATNLAILNGTTTKDINVVQNQSSKPQVLCLQKATVVQGNISFASNRGMIYSIGASKIEGKVIGAKVVQGACPGQGDFTTQSIN